MRTLYILLTLFFVLTVLSGCSNDDEQDISKRNVTYEITGNFSGKMLIVYTDNTGNLTTLTDISLPWSVEIDYPTSVLTIGISGQASATGISGQTATLKIYVNGSAVASDTKSAGSLGELAFTTLTHTF